MEIKLFTHVWEQLRVRKVQFNQYLEQVHIQNLRGITDLRIDFNYPVSVIAGPNASGKSTVLFACACAYDPEGSNPRNFTPSYLFPNLLMIADQDYRDSVLKTAFEFYYSIEKKKNAMRWAKGRSWEKSFMGQKNGKQPKRKVYLRTLANLASPNEVRSVLQIGNYKNPVFEEITTDLIAFAQRILPMQYSKVTLVKKENRDLLFVARSEDGNNKYSEFHMSAGERAILRISKDISGLNNALILIDEIEAGLHPFTQMQLMLELQRIALRNDLQIIVTSHSSVILDCVPPEARIFLERTNDNVIEKPAYKDIIQKAFYGQSTEKLSMLCEDDIGESFVLGVMDYLNPKLNLVPDDINVGRDTGKNEFPQHIAALGKFNKLSDFVFVLDADAKNLDPKLKEAAQPYGISIKPLYLPGVEIPETWAWEILSNNIQEYAEALGVNLVGLTTIIQQNNQLFDNATDKQSSKAKAKFESLCSQLRREKTEIIRMISRVEVNKQHGEIKVFADELEDQIRAWQSRK